MWTMELDLSICLLWTGRFLGLINKSTVFNTRRRFLFHRNLPSTLVSLDKHYCFWSQMPCFHRNSDKSEYVEEADERVGEECLETPTTWRLRTLKQRLGLDHVCIPQQLVAGNNWDCIDPRRKGLKQKWQMATMWGKKADFLSLGERNWVGICRLLPCDTVEYYCF